MELEFVTFNKRTDRSIYIAGRFKKYLTESLLDVGCDKAVLKGLLEGVDYTGIDVGGTPDIKIDLENTNKLPFEDSAFHTTICSDVLEHLDNLHAVFSELVRVTKKYLIISLPNNWNHARPPIERGIGSFMHYGLPSARPVDRHKWFFSFLEALDFIEAQKEIYALSIEELVVNEKPKLSIFRQARRLRYPNKIRYLNRYSHTLWVVYKKR